MNAKQLRFNKKYEIDNQIKDCNENINSSEGKIESVLIHRRGLYTERGFLLLPSNQQSAEFARLENLIAIERQKQQDNREKIAFLRSELSNLH